MRPIKQATRAAIEARIENVCKLEALKNEIRAQYNAIWADVTEQMKSRLNGKQARFEPQRFTYNGNYNTLDGLRYNEEKGCLETNDYHHTQRLVSGLTGRRFVWADCWVDAKNRVGCAELLRLCDIVATSSKLEAYGAQPDGDIIPVYL